ncbi:MAG: hypothetical protein M0P07_04800 [Candidatus Methanomethylophilaceae archaeon]|nr:hypothetical protein [Candidatus Methanomethylophilaceae archaeon]
MDQYNNYAMQPDLNRVPDKDTQEMIVYGSSYAKTKIRLYENEKLMKAADNLEKEILSEIDYDVFKVVNEYYPQLIYSEMDIPDTLLPEHKKTILLVRRLAKNKLAKPLLKDRRSKIIDAGRLIGAAEYSVQVKMRGIKTYEWETSAIQYSIDHPVIGSKEEEQS